MNWGKLISIVLVCALITSCASNVDRTNKTRLSEYSENEIKQKLIPAVTSRKDVIINFGVPVNTENYNNTKHWNYYSKIVDRRIYLIIPVINDREQFLAIDFSDEGMVTNYHYSEK
ncbi:hypothetical protein [Yersinia intermedia]|uniref:hypothetical protein n=1 Tax=Yersinia intermedia TaxID=631 RepID=UPI0005E21BC6|nr:hypothetical protein [Yersinia intermedia]MCB5311936.1 hypothetical protein [Yersinia intermedia]MCB5325339.1 hypothetical protein [Yersinia intermedia]CNH14839.1 Uncharacterised protein [Yersinia intermedia]CQD78087.1 Uncharacterised protein [Yersinia intermedia]